MKRRKELEYTCYEVIEKYKEERTGMVDALRFNKVMSLLNKDLLESGIDIRLPRCWYFYGEMTVIQELPPPSETRG